LNLFQINDLQLWAFRIITIFVILLIIFCTIKLFYISISVKNVVNTISSSSSIAAAAISSEVKTN